MFNKEANEFNKPNYNQKKNKGKASKQNKQASHTSNSLVRKNSTDNTFWDEIGKSIVKKFDNAEIETISLGPHWFTCLCKRQIYNKNLKLTSILDKMSCIKDPKIILDRIRWDVSLNPNEFSVS